MLMSLSDFATITECRYIRVLAPNKNNHPHLETSRWYGDNGRELVNRCSYCRSLETCWSSNYVILLPVNRQYTTKLTLNLMGMFSYLIMENCAICGPVNVQFRCGWMRIKPFIYSGNTCRWKLTAKVSSRQTSIGQHSLLILITMTDNFKDDFQQWRTACVSLLTRVDPLTFLHSVWCELFRINSTQLTTVIWYHMDFR